MGRQRNRHGWFVRGLSLCDLFNEGCNLVGRLGHVLRAIMQRIAGERLGIARTQVLVFHLIQACLRRWCQN
jgi:hypothetical protein